MCNGPKAGRVMIVSALRPPIFNLMLGVDAEHGHNVKFSDSPRRDSCGAPDLPFISPSTAVQDYPCIVVRQ
jgi:hypothetical protein